MSRSTLASVLVLVLASGCAGGTTASAALTSPTSPAPSGLLSVSPSDPPTSTASASSKKSSCPNPDGGDCLGVLSGGTYRTTVFELPVTYTVEAGWQNFEDMPGNFLLVPPGDSMADVDSGTANYVGVYLNTAVSRADCASGPDPSVKSTPRDMARALQKRPGLVVTTPRAVTIGRLDGVVIDLKLDPSWSSTCPWSSSNPVVPLISSLPPSSFEHAIAPGFETRLYLLRQPLGTLAIEIEIVDEARRDELTRVAEQLGFGG